MKKLLIAIVAIQHLAFLIIEMFLWTNPIGMKIFKLSSEFAIMTKDLAANQGLYNGFLFAGLVWALFERNQFFAKKISIFFLGCVIVAGVYGAYSVSLRILYIQALPAFLALILTLKSRLS